jgi:Fe-S-cluster containining protein
MIEIDSKIRNHIPQMPTDLNKKQCLCGHENFELPFIEAVYLHSKINKHFTSHQRAELIKRAIEASKNTNTPCPFNKDSNCKIYDIKPARCRMCGIQDFSADKKEIQDMLFELSQAMFLAFSGQFIPDTKFSFSLVDGISGKFVQKYFDYISGL